MICTDGKIHWKSIAYKYIRAAVINPIWTLNQAKNEG
jgi:hypothetical protein